MVLYNFTHTIGNDMNRRTKKHLEIYRHMKYAYDNFINQEDLIHKTHTCGIQFMRKLLRDELLDIVPPEYKNPMSSYIMDFDNMLCNHIITMLLKINERLQENTISYKLLQNNARTNK